MTANTKLEICAGMIIRFDPRISVVQLIVSPGMTYHFRTGDNKYAIPNLTAPQFERFAGFLACLNGLTIETAVLGEGYITYRFK
jgi:hypothetical protein